MVGPLEDVQGGPWHLKNKKEKEVQWVWYLPLTRWQRTVRCSRRVFSPACLSLSSGVAEYEEDGWTAKRENYCAITTSLL